MRFCFYSGYKDLKGGFTSLIITLINELIAQDQNIVLFNYKDGLIANELRDITNNLEIIDINDTPSSELKNFIEHEDVLVITTFSEFLSNFMEKNPVVLYYDINDFLASVSEYKFGLKFSFLSKLLIKKLGRKNSLIFMDDTGVGNLNRDFKIEISKPKYLPIPIEIPSENEYIKQNRQLTNEIRISYIGRSVDWKMYPLKKIVEDCHLTDEPIILNIVVDDKKELLKYIDVNNFEKESVKINIWENLLPSEIAPFLAEYSDVNFGMGTTALHSSAIGIPTILMDYSYHPFPQDYTYKWLWETKNYSLGKNIDKLSADPGISMKQIIHLIKNDEERNSLSNNAFNYVFSNHKSDAIVHRLIEYSSSAQFRLREAKNLYPYFWRGHSIMKNIYTILKK